MKQFTKRILAVLCSLALVLSGLAIAPMQETKAAEVIESVGNRVAALHIGNMHEAPLNFVTADAYPGGSTVTFEAYLPEDIAQNDWWGAALVTDVAAADIYACANNNLMNIANAGMWATYTVTLPADGQYYIAIGGAPGTGSGWYGKTLLVDDFKVTNADGNVIAEDDFEHSFADGLFVVNQEGANYAGTEEAVKAVSYGVINEGVTEQAAKLHFGQFHEVLTNFVTSEAYPGGTTVVFDAYVPEGLSGNKGWWGIAVTTDPSKSDIYACASPSLLDQNKLGQWTTYTIALPNDDQNYYIGFGGCVGHTNDWHERQLLLDNFKILNADGSVLAEDDFNHSYDEGLFKVDVNGYDYGTGTSAVAVSHWSPSADYATAIDVDLLNDVSPMNFITKEKYAGGSTVSFKAYVPEGASWWATSWTTDNTDVGLYKWNDDAIYGQAMSSTTGAWAEYSVTLPNDGQEYYFYVVGARGEWGGKKLLIDDLKITAADGTILVEDNFNVGIGYGMIAAYNKDGCLSSEFVAEICDHTFVVQDTYEELTCDKTKVEHPFRCLACAEVFTVAHTPEDVEEKEATCKEPGHTAGTNCSVCGEILSGMQEIGLAEHQIVHYDAIEATCNQDGQMEHWYCKECHVYWTDEALTQPTDLASILVEKTDVHKPVKLPAKPAEIGKTGLTEGSKCSVCDKILEPQKVVAAKKLATPKSSKVTKVTGGEKQITVKFKKISGVTRYEIQIATKKNMKKGLKAYTVKKAKDMKNGKYVVKKLKAKTTYYVRIRTVKTVNGVTKKSSWSKVVKATKTK